MSPGWPYFWSRAKPVTNMQVTWRGPIKQSLAFSEAQKPFTSRSPGAPHAAAALLVGRTWCCDGRGWERMQRVSVPPATQMAQNASSHTTAPSWQNIKSVEIKSPPFFISISALQLPHRRKWARSLYVLLQGASLCRVASHLLLLHGKSPSRIQAQ